MQLIPTILCGGAGSRLWPVSREQHPKPFIRLNDNQSFLQKAFLRGAQLDNVSNILTVTNRDLFFKIEDEYQELSKQLITPINHSFILEPSARNTAPAIAAAALNVAQTYGEDALLLVLTADHLISDQTAFSNAVNRAVELAEKGTIVTFGIEPNAPETGYGYIESDGERLVSFVEKPNLETAEKYLDSGRFLWNSGMFCFSAKTMLREFEIHSPEILSSMIECLAESRTTHGKEFFQVKLNADKFKSIPNDSIDYAIMEKTSQASVVACNIGWSDIGCWQAMSNLMAPCDNDNRVQGHTILKSTQNCTIQGETRTIATVGVKNLIIVDTDDALLVVHKECAQQVKEVYAELKSQNHQVHKFHKTVHRPWGTYTVLEEGPCFKIKRIEVKPGASLSLQMHHHRSEHWVVVSGEAKVINDEQTLMLSKDQSTFIPARNKHRLSNFNSEPLIMIEVQTGSYLGEDDIVRFDDVYGRVEAETCSA